MTSKMFCLEGKKCVLTGAAGFFGRYFAKALLEAGVEKIFLVDKDHKGLNELGQDLSNTFRGRFHLCVLDQYHRDEAEIVLKILADNNVDILINNSFDFSTKTGFNSAVGRIEHAPYEQFLASFESGVWWPFQATQVFANAMKKTARGGVIINIGSMYSLISPNPDLYEGMEYINPPGYSIAKNAVVALTRYTAAFYAPLVRANTLLPGAIPNHERTSDNSEQNKDAGFRNRLVSRTLLKRLGHPTDLTGPLVFLASDASRYMTGQTLVVDGGWVIT